MKVRFRIILFSTILLLSCSTPSIPEPEAVLLLSPANAESCVTISSTGSIGLVSFDWEEALNTDSYELVVRNSVTQREQKTTVDLTSATLGIDRGASYTWWVNSSSEISPVTTRSEVWSFYFEALQQKSYVPFSAHLINPLDEEIIVLSPTGLVNLQWEGLDLDDNIVYYQVFIGPSRTQLNLVQDNQTAPSYSATLNAGQTYFWQIITIDASGNKSQSAVQSFTTS